MCSDNEQAKQKAQKALELRLQGMTLAVIAEQCGYSDAKAAFAALQELISAVVGV